MMGLLLFLAVAASAEPSAMESLRREVQAARPGSSIPSPLRLRSGQAYPLPAERGEELRTYTGVIHCHSHLSFDSRGTFGQIAAAARRAGVDFVIMTDHPGPGVPESQPRGFVGGALFLPGIETEHLLALDVSRPVQEGSAAEVARQVVAQGGLALVAHPELFTEWDAPGLSGTEIYNLHADISDEYLPWAAAKGLWSYGRGAGRALLSVLDFPGPAFPRWDQQSARRPFLGIAANDAHQNLKLLGTQLDPYEVPFRFVNTCVLAPRLDPDSVMAALRAGRAYVVFRAFGEPDGFEFTASDGMRSAAMGGTLEASQAATLFASAPGPCLFRLFRNGVLVLSEERSGQTAALRAGAGPGLYRLEVWKLAGSRFRPWILSNPIRIRLTDLLP